MRYSEARVGRAFIIRLEDGEVLHEAIEAFARAHAITAAAAVVVLGGADEGSRLVVGPEEGRSMPVSPIERVLTGVHEIAGVGTIFPDIDRKPVLHLHIACGRKDSTITGCVRRGVKVWQVQEVILLELLDTRACRRYDPRTGFELLEP